MELYNACESGNHKNVVKCLQNKCTNINQLIQKHHVKQTALHVACEYTELKIIKELIAYGADVNIVSSDLRLPLHNACIGGREKIVEYLLPLTKDVNLQDVNGQTAAHVASYHGEVSCLKVLLQHSCDVERRDIHQRSCMDLIVLRNHHKALDFLLQECPELVSMVTTDGRSSVHTACQYGALECMKVFRKHRHDFITPDSNGVLPIHIAATHGQVKVLEYLLKVGGGKLASTDSIGRSVIHFASASGSTQCLHFVLENGGDVAGIDNKGNTPTHYASMVEGSSFLINCLKNHHADFQVKSLNGDTPLDCARKGGWPVKFEKAVNGEIVCPHCNSQQEQMIRDEAHKLSTVEEKISLQQSALFNTNTR